MISNNIIICVFFSSEINLLLFLFRRFVDILDSAFQGIALTILIYIMGVMSLIGIRVSIK